MRLAFLALALTFPAASSALPAAAPPSQAPAANRFESGTMPSRFCSDDMKVRPIRSPEGARPKRLGELPPGDLTLAVLNRVGDCIEPVTVAGLWRLRGDDLARFTAQASSTPERGARTSARRRRRTAARTSIRAKIGMSPGSDRRSIEAG